MNQATYKSLKRANRHKVIDRAQLKKQRSKSNPSIRRAIDYYLDEDSEIDYHNNWGIELNRFTTDFSNNPSLARDRLDETVTTYLLFLSSQLTQAKLVQTFHAPGHWESEYSWVMLFKWLVYAVFTLSYRIEWHSEYFFWIDDMMIELMKGRSNALREFAERIGVRFSSSEYPAEKHFSDIRFHTSRVFGPYYWRMIHFIAEAFALRDDASNREDVILAKQLWREFTVQSLHRTLQCSLCIHHYKRLVTQKYKDKLLNTSDQNYPELWFDFHNDVRQQFLMAFTKSDFEKDRLFMKSALTS